ncbi:MAG: DUF969 domain-containing protein [Eubacteriales bacterium]|nr:DUF969 domain-containing protein [Eubacteriales bacterium]
MEYLKLIGILIVIAGFALKLDSILIIFLAAVSTALVSGLGISGLLEAFGTNFVSNRSMAIFIMILLVTGTLERNGLREAAAAFIRKFKNVTVGRLICIYGAMRAFFGAFNVGFGGHAGFIRPVLLPMEEGAAEDENGEVNPEYLEEIKGMSAAIENITWFFFQVLFVGGSGALLVQSTLSGLGYEVELIDLAKVEIPVALTALVLSCIYFLLKDKKLRAKYKKH